MILDSLSKALWTRLERVGVSQAAERSEVELLNQALRDHARFKPPSGGSVIAQAVNQAVARTPLNQTVPASLQYTRGSVEAIWLKGTNWKENEIIDRVIEELARARHEIRIQTYTFDFQSDANKKLMDALVKKQKENPDFKVVISYNGEIKLAIGSFMKTFRAEEMRKALVEYGLKADVASYQKLPGLHMNHAKSYILDGVVGITGGVNIQNHPSQDMMVKITGPAVESLLADFASGWREARQFFRSDGKQVVDTGADALPEVTRGQAPPSAFPAVNMTALSKTASDRIAGNTGFYANDANQGLLAAVKAANKRIRIQTPNFNDPVMWQELAAAAERGVQVELMLPRRFNHFRSIVDGGNNNQFIEQFWAQLGPDAQKNVHVRWFSANGKEAATNNNHTKLMTVDGVWTYVGSQNMDKQSWQRSREFGFGIDDAATAARFDQILDHDWANGFEIPRPRKATDNLLEWLQRNWGWAPDADKFHTSGLSRFGFRADGQKV
jgi:cardiolipin synthase